MADEKGKKPPAATADTPPRSRQQRLASELRANLARRKEQARARRAQTDKPPGRSKG